MRRKDGGTEMFVKDVEKADAFSPLPPLTSKLRLPLYAETVTGEGREIGKDYLPMQGYKVEDLCVCLRLGLTPLAYLWKNTTTCI